MQTTQNMQTGETSDSPATLRDRALKRIQKRREFYAHLAVYLLVNGALVVVWAMTSTDVIFWPMFPMLGWGIGLVMHGWDVFYSSDVTEADIDREVARMNHR